MARLELGRALGERGIYSGTFEGKHRPGKRPATMYLLRDIKNSSGAIVTDHLWFRSTKRIVAINPRPGDLVQFEARVRIYVRKGGSTDYLLSHPTKFQIIAEKSK